MEEPEEISDPRGESLIDQMSDKIHGDEDSSGTLDSESEVNDSEVRETPSPYPHPSSVKERFNRVFVRERPAEVDDGGQTAEIFWWRNKTTATMVFCVVTAIWFCFEVLEYHFLTLICHVTILGLGLLFLWSNTSTLINKRPPHIPAVHLPKDPFLVFASTLHNEISEALEGLREIAVSRDLKRFLMVVVVMWIISIVGSFWNFLTLFYIAFCFLYTLPVLYDTYSEKIDAFAENAITEICKVYAVFSSKVLHRLPKEQMDKKKVE
ncbi:reticulon-like protein B5 [Andrographis paniculata]|uniref:reticulon-like protein B5 n=1 Tax=Andrographis paniculata TaxID=175694 RepID=UPI0021E80E6F|nr:reticulon-like protein B5 [Andrographis paniculata]